ncbi:MAG: hypothetical protein JW913_04740 [Chitinispirillaceae bacterium]|nr:hypothetical protein [Chitinispirillaceae bacterium]
MNGKVLISAILPLLFQPAAAASGSFSWTTVAIGGGGFVSAIIPSAVEQNLFYARTDVGGAYRWDASSRKWISMMDWVDASERGLLGVEAIAADPESARNGRLVDRLPQSAVLV